MTPDNFWTLRNIFPIYLAYLQSWLSEESQQLAGYVLIILNFQHTSSNLGVKDNFSYW